MEILNFTRRDIETDRCEVWDYCGMRLFEGTWDECADYISENEEHEDCF